ncbi:hypothetical protein C8T65DRAFT_282574 [Cerioporus squamosus]|nr:hypothetical protein C8T65DRAFT_282574 [Cerioporus squamosus]
MLRLLVATPCSIIGSPLRQSQHSGCQPPTLSMQTHYTCRFLRGPPHVFAAINPEATGVSPYCPPAHRQCRCSPANVLLVVRWHTLMSQPCTLRHCSACQSISRMSFLTVSWLAARCAQRRAVRCVDCFPDTAGRAATSVLHQTMIFASPLPMKDAKRVPRRSASGHALSQTCPHRRLSERPCRRTAFTLLKGTRRASITTVRFECLDLHTTLCTMISRSV